MRAALPPSGRTDWRDFVLLGIGATALLHGVSSGAFTAAGVGALVVTTSLAGMRKTICRRWLYMASGSGLLVLGMLAVLGRRHATPDTLWAMASGLALLGGCVLPRRPENLQDEVVAPPGGPLVLLERSPRYVDAGILECIAANALPPVSASLGSWEVRGEKPEFQVLSPEIGFSVRVVDEPYWTSDDEVTASVTDVRAQRKAIAHIAFIEVACNDIADTHPPELLDRWQRALVAGLMGEQTLGLFEPLTGAFREADTKLAQLLTSETPRSQLFSCPLPPVVRVSSDDPLLAAAVNEARRRWPEFVSAFSERHPEQHFSVKAPVTYAGRTEHIWVEVTAVTTDYVCGRLGNDPVDLGALKLGDPITVPVSALEDWLYVLSSEPVGGFTIPIVTSARRRARQDD